MLFKRRKPVYSNVTYLFDVLNESNLASTTNVVTTIKPAKKRKTWIVRSVNTGDVFECPEELLTEFVSYDSVNDIVRCQYGTTDIEKADVEYVLLVNKMLKSLKDGELGAAELKCLIEDRFLEYGEELAKKLGSYATISDYKHILAMVSSYKKVKKGFKNIEKKRKEIHDEYNDATMLENNRMKNVVDSSKFAEDFSIVINDFINGELSFDEYIDSALDCLETVFPKEAMKPLKSEYKNITKGDIRYMMNEAYKVIKKGDVVFLVGVEEASQTQIALAVYDIDDFKEIGKFINTVYKGWTDKNTPYYSDYRIIMVTGPKSPMKFMEDESNE